METNPDTGQPPQGQDHILSDTQQAVLDCTSCFTVNGEAIRANDVVDCRKRTTQTALSALRFLEQRGLISNETPERQRNTAYRSTAAGIRATTPDLDPWSCATSGTPPELSSIETQTLACIACKAQNDMPTTAATLRECTGEALTYTLKTLADRSFITAEKGTASHNANTYSLTESGAKQVPAATEECQTAKSHHETQTAAAAPLSKRQQAIIDCMRCQAAQGAPIATRKQVSLCLGVQSNKLKKELEALSAEKRLVKAEDQRPGLRSKGKTHGYSLSMRVEHEPKVRTPCTWEQPISTVYERLSDSRQRILGCLACIAHKVDRGAPVPGANVPMITACSETSEALARKFITAMTDEGYLEEHAGYSVNGASTTYLSPSASGDELLRKHRQTHPGFNSDCTTLLEDSPRVPVHIRDAVIRCLGCIWTQQTVQNEPPAARARHIASCTGLSLDHIHNTVLPGLATEGYIEKTSTTNAAKHRVIAYMPTNRIGSPFGYVRGCNLEIYEHKLEQVQPDEALDSLVMAPAVKEVEAFEQFVEALPATPAEDSWEYEAGGRLQSLPLLTAEEEAFLGLVIQKSPDPSTVARALDRFIRSNIRLAGWMARTNTFESRVTSFDDVTQAALIGIANAARTFDPMLGIKFSVHAYWEMRANIQKTASEYAGIPKWIISLIPITFWHIHEFKQQRGRTPDATELAFVSGRRINNMRSIVSAINHLMRSTIPLDTTRFSDSETKTLHETIGADDQGLAEATVYTVFDAVKPYCNELERAVLDGIFIEQNMDIGAISTERNIHSTEVTKALRRVHSLLQHPFFNIRSALIDTATWEDDARCQVVGDDTVLGTPKRGPAEYATCTKCPVKQFCYNLAKNATPKMSTGIWGGYAVRHFAS